MDPRSPAFQKISTPGRRSSGKEGMGAGTRSDPIYFPDAAHPPLQNLYTRRLSKSGTMAAIKPVTTKDLADGYYYESAQDRAEHRDFPNPHNYTVRVMNREDCHKFGCRCVSGCKWDPVTQQAEVRCRCGNNFFDPGDYVGEWEDNDKFYMGDEGGGSQKPRITQSVFGGNPYNC
jgi:hypothetical protein